MTLDEAYSEAVCSMDLSAAHLQPGVVLTYEGKGFLRKWPTGDSCSFIPTPEDEAADWFEVVPVRIELPKPAPPKWGVPKPKSLDDTIAEALARNDAMLKPVDVPIVDAVTLKPVDPLAGCGDAVSAPWNVPPARDTWGRPIG